VLGVFVVASEGVPFDGEDEEVGVVVVITIMKTPTVNEIVHKNIESDEYEDDDDWDGGTGIDPSTTEMKQNINRSAVVVVVVVAGFVDPAVVVVVTSEVAVAVVVIIIVVGSNNVYSHPEMACAPVKKM